MLSTSRMTWVSSGALALELAVQQLLERARRARSECSSTV